MLRRGDNNRVDVFARQHFVHIHERPRRATVGLGARGDGAFAVDFPEITDRCGLNIQLVFQMRKDEFQAAPAVSDADVAE